MDIIKISLIGVGGVMLGFLLKGTRPEYASLVTMGIGLLILGLAVGKVAYLLKRSGVSGKVFLLMKVIFRRL